MEKNFSDTTSFLNLDDTSPSQLQEVTEETNSSSSVTMGMLNSAPISVKEYDDQLKKLRNENFNLKLRIYYLEEKMGINFTLNQDNVLKQNIDLQIQVSNLQKELQEKHDLLCQAVKAMELEDEQHKTAIQNREEILNQYKQELEDLKNQIKANEYESVSDKSEFYNRYSNTDLQDKIKTLETELNVQKEINRNLQFKMDQTDNIHVKYELLKQENQLKDDRIQTLLMDAEKSTNKLTNIIREKNELEEQLQKSSNDNQRMVNKVEENNRVIDDMLVQINELKHKYICVKSDLEREHKRFERTKLISERKIDELEEQNKKQKLRLNDLQTKLDAAIFEVKKNQNLAVAKTTMNSRKTDVDSFSVSNPTTPNGTPKKDTLPLPLMNTPSSSISSSISSPLNPQMNIKIDVVFKNLEQLLSGCGERGEKLLCDIIELRNELNKKDEKIIKLKSEQIKACEIIKSMIESRNKANDEIQFLKFKYAELEEELESVATKQEKQPKSKEGNTDKTTMGDSICEDYELIDQYKALVTELETKIEVLVATLNEKDSQLQMIKARQEDLLTNLDEKESRIVDLEFELVSKEKNNEEKSDLCPDEYYKQEIRSKEVEIERLNCELKKCTCYLQEIVNKELWEKNREIEKMQTKCSTSEFMKMKKELEDKTQQLNLLKEKITEMGVEVDLKSEENNIDYEEQINELKQKNESLEKLQNETNEVCTLLSNRLKELAIFLDSLIKQKCVLGFLGAQKNRQLREMIDNSLEFSRSFTMNMLVNPDESLVQLNNITSLLNGTIFQDLTMNESNLTFESHLYSKTTNENEPEQERIIKTLREQIVKLNSELQVRDNELNRLIGADCIRKQSDTESLSLEYQQTNVVNKLNTTSTTLKYQSDQSESESWSEPDRNVSKQRIGLNNITPAMVLMKSTESTEDESITPSKRTSNRQTIIELQKLNAEFELELARKETQLKHAEEERNVALNEIQLLQASVKQLDSIKNELEVNMEKKDKEMQDKLNNIIAEKEILLKASEKLQKDLENSETTVKNLQNEVKVVQENLMSENQANLTKLQNEYSNNYVKKSEMEEKLQKLEQFTKELNDLKSLVKSYEETIEKCKLNESEMLTKLNNATETISQLQANLNEVSTQYSNVIIEKTRIENENQLLIQELEKTKQKGDDLLKYLNEIQNEFTDSTKTIQQQLTTVQREKSQLEVKISELESTNAELHNKLIREQSGVFKRQISGSYSSEDDFKLRNVTMNRSLIPQIDFERNKSNASPDLGIESDQGRFSSLETNQRPLLQTIELTETMSNLLDGENNPIEGVNCDGEHCCKKSIEITRENTDLKKKLLRMKRALEETANQLNIANQRKLQVEKTICKQIHKTSQVLRQARANLDSGSESDALRN